MIKHSTLTALFLSCLAFLMLMIPASPARSATKAITPSGLDIALVRAPDLQLGQFILSLTARNTVTGCPKIGPILYRGEFKDIFLDIKLGPYRLSVDNQSGICDTRQQTPTADILLSYQALKRHGTRTIRFHTPYGIEYYNVSLGQNVITMQQERPTSASPYVQPAQLPFVHDTLTHWFYPKGTVILYAPDAAPDEDISDKLEDLALHRGVVPLETFLPHFVSPVDRPHHYYYVDKSARFTDQEEPLILGEFPAPVTIYGLEENYTEQRPKKVFARTPRRYE